MGIFARKRKKKGQSDPRARLRAVLGDYELPNFPAVVMDALDKVSDPDAAFQEISDLVMRDPGLSAHLLKMVNSAAVAPRSEVRSIHHAVCMLGRNQLESVLIGFGAKGVLPSECVVGYDPIRFWTAASRRAATAAALADRIDPRTRSESFTAGLLQDMALPVLSHGLGRPYGELLEHWHHDGDADLVELERRSFAWDHAQVASWISRQWRFPDALAQAIAAHHGSADDGAHGLAAVTLVAPLRETDDERGVERLVETAHALHGLAKDEAIAIVQAGFEQAEDIARVFV